MRTWKLTSLQVSEEECTLCCLHKMQLHLCIEILINESLEIERNSGSNTGLWTFLEKKFNGAMCFPLKHTIRAHSDWQGPGEASSPSPCPEQAQPWAQTIESEHEIPKDEYGPTPLGPGSSICLSSWGNGFSYLQSEPFMFQHVQLPLALPPPTAVRSPAVSSPSLPSVLGMLLAAPEAIPSPDRNSPGPRPLLAGEGLSGLLSTPVILSIFLLYWGDQNCN